MSFAPLSLTAHRRPALSGGRPRQLVLLLHGYGADGQDLLSLAPHWAEALPDCAFVAPDAPYPCEIGFGRQWFGLEGADLVGKAAAARAAATLLDAFIDSELALSGLGDEAAALVGFSQGTMMALNVAPRRPRALAAVVGYSGLVVDGESLASETRSRPPVLLIHGDADPMIPFAAMAAARAALAAAGLPVETLARPGLGHSIDEAGLRRGGAFLVDAFAAAARRPMTSG
jgi:phospholipase/carboxylesterase